MYHILGLQKISGDGATVLKEYCWKEDGERGRIRFMREGVTILEGGDGVKVLLEGVCWKETGDEAIVLEGSGWKEILEGASWKEARDGAAVLEGACWKETGGNGILFLREREYISPE